MDIDIIGSLKFGTVLALVLAAAYLIWAMYCGWRNQHRNKNKNGEE